MKVGHRYQDWKKFRAPPPSRFRAKYLCPSCRHVFKRELDGTRDQRVCPSCGGAALRMGRDFKPPPLTDTRRWKVVLVLVEAGFRYGRYAPQPIPKTMGAAKKYIARFAPFGWSQNPGRSQWF